MGKNIGKNISKNLSGKYSQNLLDQTKQVATDACKTTLKRVIQKKSLLQNNSETITNEHDIEIPKERYIYICPEERQKIIDDLNYDIIIMEYKKIINFLGNASNQPSKVRTKNWVKINDESRGTYNKDKQIRFKTSV